MVNSIKQPKQLALIKRYVSENVINLMNRHFLDRDYPTRTAKATALAKKSGLGRNTVLRLIDPDDTTCISIDNLECLATALGVFTYQLLIPFLDIDNPQVPYIPSNDEDEQIHCHMENVESIDDEVLKLARAIDSLQSGQRKRLCAELINPDVNQEYPKLIKN